MPRKGADRAEARATTTIERLNAAIARILQDPAIVEKLAPQALAAVGGTPEQFAALYRDDYEKYGRLIKELTIRLD